MSNIVVRNYGICYVDGESEKLLIESGNRIKNISAVPIFTDDNSLCVKSMIEQLKNFELQMQNNLNCINCVNDFELIDVLFSKKLLSYSVPVKVLEIGATTGELSFHLASIMQVFNKNSNLCCVTDVIGSGSENHWLDRVSIAKDLPNLSLLVSDYNYIPFEREHFDLVVINGSVQFEDVNKIVLDAACLVNPSGEIICYCKDQNELAQRFRNVFKDCESYSINDYAKVLVKENVCFKPDEDIWNNNVAEFLEKIADLLNSNPSSSLLRLYIKKIDDLIEASIQRNEIDAKVKLIDIKGVLLDAIVR